MTGTKFDIKKIDGNNDFALWKVKMKALLEHRELATTLEELLAATIVAYDKFIREKTFSALILCLGDRVLREIIKETTATGIWKKKLETLYMTKSLANHLYLKKKLYTPSTCIRMTKAKGDGGKGLYVKRGSAQRDMEQGTYSAWNKDQVSGSGADRYDNADVMMAMSVEELLDMIMNSGGSYHITYMRDYLVDFEEYEGGNILLGDGRECRVWGTGKVQVQMRDGSSFVLDIVMYISELRRNLISLCTLEKEGFTVKMQSAKIEVIKGSLVVLSRTRRDNCVYTIDGQAMTMKTLKGRKQLGKYQTGWKIKMGNVLDSYNQRSTQQCMKSGVAKHLGVAGLQQQNGLVKETNVHYWLRYVIF
nr:zinc finger, CCHC-type [Tanacetum cinerariifolium]